MKISFKYQAVEKKNSAACSVTEYALNNAMLDAAIATIAGRYPDECRVVNQQCDELAYIFEGEGKIVINQEEHQLSAGDVVLIEAGEKYFWEGNMKLFLSCRPAWNKEQHKIVD
jgi:mannose-6-phosphate isomerase-like protein (cupin superfamily)